MIRKRVVFKGAVQGVGFRYTTAHLARGYNVTGYVRNLSDGRVELVVEGLVKEIEAFVHEIRQTMIDYIREADVRDEPANGEFARFGIRY